MDDSYSASLGDTISEGQPSDSAPEQVASSDFTGQQKSAVQRTVPTLTEARKAYISKWQSEIRADKKHWEDVTKRMRDDMELCRLGDKKAWVDADKYSVPLINRQINQAVASLYAKNPTVQAKRKMRMNYMAWDGRKDSLQAAVQMAQMGDPNAMAIIQEVQQAQASNLMLDRMGKTLEIVFNYYTTEDTPNFKQQMKQLVRRTKICGAGFVDLMFQRVLEPDAGITERIDDMTRKLAVIESQLADIQDGVKTQDSATAEELKFSIEDLRAQQMIIIREGLVFDFPRSTEIIPHRACRQLKGFIGADHLTREYHMTRDQIQETYKIDIGTSYNAYKKSGSEDASGDSAKANQDTAGRNSKDEILSCVWRVQDKRTRQVFVMVDGYPDFIKEPAAPDVKVDGFWTSYALTFNDVESEKDIYPMSDVYYMRHPQREYNTTRQNLREHRRANRPKYFMRKGLLDDQERKNLEEAPAFAVIEIGAISPETKIDALIQPFKPVGIDPNLYETQSIINDILYGVGAQSADLGPSSGGGTATESSISENSRQSSLASNVDDLDEFLSDLARASGQVLLAELSLQTAQEIAGPGAIWPQLNQDAITKELMLDIRMGSSGRPNKAADLANMERALPYLLQMGGINMEPLARRYGDLLDLDQEEFIAEGMPSVTAMNAMAAKAAMMGAGGQPQVGTGDPATDPAQQGGAGVQNAPSSIQNEPGAQPAYPAPHPGHVAMTH